MCLGKRWVKERLSAAKKRKEEDWEEKKSFGDTHGLVNGVGFGRISTGKGDVGVVAFRLRYTAHRIYNLEVVPIFRVSQPVEEDNIYCLS